MAGADNGELRDALMDLTLGQFKCFLAEEIVFRQRIGLDGRFDKDFWVLVNAETSVAESNHHCLLFKGDL